MSINLSNCKGYKFVMLLSKCSNLDEFKTNVLLEFNGETSIKKFFYLIYYFTNYICYY